MAKPSTRKTLFITTSALLITGGISAAEQSPYKGFTTHIEVRQSSDELSQRSLPADPTVALKKQTSRLTSIFPEWEEANPADILKQAVNSPDDQPQQLDGVVSHLLTGAPLSKQDFFYTEDGKPLEARNYTPDANGEFIYAGHYLYTYDELGRLIAAESTSVSYPSSNVRYEYIYADASPRYSMQLAYFGSENGDWIPYQKGEYEFDANGNTTLETYFMWEQENNQWLPQIKKVARYDLLNRMTYYAPYVWDTATSDWVGDVWQPEGAQSFEYTENGSDACVAQYEWREGEWIEYYRRAYTYNTSGLKTEVSHSYWNREKQDWSGCETWGRFNNMKYNSIETLYYDEYGRLVFNKVVEDKTGDGEFIEIWNETSDYTALGDNNTEKVVTTANVQNDGTAVPYRRNVYRYNARNYETFWQSQTMSAGEWVPTQEDNRYYDEYFWYTGGDFYIYNAGQRINNAKERFFYPDDFNPMLEYETPSEGWHWVGDADSEDGWKLKSVDEFMWGPRDIMTGYINYDYLISDGAKTSGWEIEYDFDYNMSNMVIWPDPNKSEAYYENKTLHAIYYANNQYWNGVIDWIPEQSYEVEYFYSDRQSTKVSSILTDAGVTEVARYDISGRQLTIPQTGVNIIKYSDGTARKVFVP
ncbi:MAG: hypothetical protein K2K26_03000 [Muribaculaceae bacterium]|nr:hypothetical protein [Muribaculaceae bacterium]